jgi:hypothetical protein
MSGVPLLLNDVPCLLNEVSCLVSLVPCSMSEVPCLMSEVPCLMKEVLCSMNEVPCRMNKVSGISFPISEVPLLMSYFLYTSLCTGELNAIRKHECFSCFPFYVKGVSLGYVGRIKTYRT